MDSFVRIVKCDTPKEGGVDDEGEDSEQDRLGPEEKERQRELERQREKEQARVPHCATHARLHEKGRAKRSIAHACSRSCLCSGQGKGMGFGCLECLSLQRFGVCDQ